MRNDVAVRLNLLRSFSPTQNSLAPRVMSRDQPRSFFEEFSLSAGLKLCDNRLNEGVLRQDEREHERLIQLMINRVRPKDQLADGSRELVD